MPKMARCIGRKELVESDINRTPLPWDEVIIERDGLRDLGVIKRSIPSSVSAVVTNLDAQRRHVCRPYLEAKTVVCSECEGLAGWELEKPHPCHAFRERHVQHPIGLI